MRRRRLTRLSRWSSMWSVTGGGGSNSGTRRRSGSAGGSLRLMALSSATPSGALRGPLVDVSVIMLYKFQSWFLLWSSSPCRLCSGGLVHFLDRVMDVPVGYLVGDAQCTLCTGPWSSTGPGSWYGVERPLLCNNRCRGRLSSRMLVRQWIHFLRLYLVGYGRISHIFT